MSDEIKIGSEWWKMPCENPLLVQRLTLKDMCCSILEKSGEPLHYKEIAKRLEADYGKTFEHVKSKATTITGALWQEQKIIGNGRGYYFLKEWEEGK